MQKSFLLVLGAFLVVAFMFVVNEDNVKNDEVITTFEVRDSGIKVSNSLTGENFVIANDEIVDVSVAGLTNIEPAAGDEHHDDTVKEAETHDNDAERRNNAVHEDANEDSEDEHSKGESKNDAHHEEKEDEKL